MMVVNVCSHYCCWVSPHSIDLKCTSEGVSGCAPPCTQSLARSASSTSSRSSHWWNAPCHTVWHLPYLWPILAVDFWIACSLQIWRNLIVALGCLLACWVRPIGRCIIRCQRGQSRTWPTENRYFMVCHFVLSNWWGSRSSRGPSFETGRRCFAAMRPIILAKSASIIIQYSSNHHPMCYPQAFVPLFDVRCS